MRIHFKALLISSLVGLGAVSCAPEEKQLCEHMMKIWGGKADAPAFLGEMDSCVEYYQSRTKQRGVNSYRRESECILGVDTVYKIRRCIEKEDHRMR